VKWDDANIVEALLSSEEGAWDYFVERHAGLVVGCVRRILRGRGLRPSQADVDDLSENVFVMLLEKDGALLRNYDPRYKLNAYLAVISRTAVHRWLRRQKAKTALPEEMWGDAIEDRAEETISEGATRVEVLSALREVLEALPERDRRVLRLCYFEGQDYQSIARTLGISINSVGAALSRARARLAEALKRHQGLSESDWRSV